jgi:hypothetical protein
MKRTLLASLMITCIVTSFAQTASLEGTIGNIPVIMKLDMAEGDTLFSAEYFYAKQRKIIELIGRDKNGTLTLENEVLKEKFILKKKEEMYTGTWVNKDKRLAVNLKPIQVNDKKGAYDNLSSVINLKTYDPYKYLLVSGYVFNKDSTTSKNGYYIDWYKEKYTGLQMVQIRNDGTSAAIEKINLELKENIIDECMNASYCSATGSITEYGAVVNSVFISKEIFSCNVCVEVYCGGAYPVSGCTGYNLDMKTGESVSIDDVIWFGEAIQPPYRERNTGDDTVFMNRVLQLMVELYPSKVKSETENDCPYESTELWIGINWYFTDKGMRIEPMFPHILQACSSPDWGIIPYTILRKYRNPKGKIQLPAN